MLVLWFIVLALSSISAYRRGEGKSKGYFSAVVFSGIFIIGIIDESHSYQYLLSAASVAFMYFLGKSEGWDL